MTTMVPASLLFLFEFLASLNLARGSGTDVCPAVCFCRFTQTQNDDLSFILSIDCHDVGTLTAVMMSDQVPLTESKLLEIHRQSPQGFDVWFDGSGNNYNQNRISSNMIENVSTRMKSIRLCCSGLTSIAVDAFGDIEGVEVLDLSNNKLRYLDFISQLPNLTQLIMDSNLISAIPRSVARSVPKLKYFSIRYNQLITMAFMAQTMPLLEYVDLSHNRLQVISTGALHDKPYLRYVNFSSNFMQWFKYCEMKPLLQGTFQRSIDISDNPVLCSCELVWIGEIEGTVLHATCAGRTNWTTTSDATTRCAAWKNPPCESESGHSIGWNPYDTLPTVTTLKVTRDAGEAEGKTPEGGPSDEDKAAANAQIILLLLLGLLTVFVVAGAILRNRHYAAENAEKEEEDVLDEAHAKYARNYQQFRLSIAEQGMLEAERGYEATMQTKSDTEIDIEKIELHRLDEELEQMDGISSRRRIRSWSDTSL